MCTCTRACVCARARTPHPADHSSPPARQTPPPDRSATRPTAFTDRLDATSPRTRRRRLRHTLSPTRGERDQQLRARVYGRRRRTDADAPRAIVRHRSISRTYRGYINADMYLEYIKPYTRYNPRVRRSPHTYIERVAITYEMGPRGLAPGCSLAAQRPFRTLLPPLIAAEGFDCFDET